MSSLSIQAVEITNFRPYREASVDFTETDGHVHVIEGDQGAGKTSFHRAVQWGLYGGDGPTHNYKTNWNADAREEEYEEMEVRIKLSEAGDSHVLHRDIKRFNHGDKRAIERLRIMSGDEPLKGDDAQEFINSRVPEDLKDFFFLDGEEIRDLIEEQRGEEIREEIEKVLKHTAILHATEDLDSVLDDRYKPKYSELEEEHEERSKLQEKISGLEEEKADLRDELNGLESNKESLEDDLEEARELLEERNEEVMRQISDLENRIADLRSERLDLADDLKQAWEHLPLGILSEEIEELRDELTAEINECDRRLAEANEQELLDDLVAEAKDGECPICGGTDHDIKDVQPPDPADSEERLCEAEIEERKVTCRQRRDILTSAPAFDPAEHSPGPIADELSETENDITETEADKDELLEEYGGEITESEKGDLEQSINSLRAQIDDLEENIEEKREEILDIKDEITEKRNEKKKKAGSDDLKEVQRKIEAAEDAEKVLRGVREAHIEKKREDIREEMNAVFDIVSQSEFISQRYDGIDFRGDPEDEDRFVIELVENDGDRKRMADHPPSAGETQITALSFIFGLNKFARYSTTIVFDTVAGRLDKTNSRAQGDFFGTLDEDIILLVTDSELEEIYGGIEDEIGKHYEIRMADDGSSEFQEVEG